MEYINDTREAVAARSESSRLKLIHSKVEKIRRSEKCGVKYMQRWEEIAYARQDGYEKGHSEGHSEGFNEGLQVGELQKIITAICKKLEKGKGPEQIADELEEDLGRIFRICSIAEKYAPDYDEEAICWELTGDV